MQRTGNLFRMYPALALGHLGWAPTDLCNRVQEGAGTEDGWIDSFCNMQFLSSHSTSEIDYRAFHLLMTFLYKVEKCLQAVVE